MVMPPLMKGPSKGNIVCIFQNDNNGSREVETFSRARDLDEKEGDVRRRMTASKKELYSEVMFKMINDY